MYWQNRYLEQAKSFSSTSGLDIIDLPNHGLLGCVHLELGATAGSTAGDRDCNVLDCITKIEFVVNGSQVIKSLNGSQLKALMFFQKMSQCDPFHYNVASGAGAISLYINLGRHYHDYDYMLDLSKVTDPEIRITYDFTITSHDGFTNGEAHTSPVRDVVCHLLRDSNVVPKGYIKTTELFRQAWASGGKINMTVPRGPVYSNMYLQSFYMSSGLSFTLDELEVNINSDNVIPLRITGDELLSLQEAHYGRFQYQEVRGVDFVSLVPWNLEVGVFDWHEWGQSVGLIPALSAMWGQNSGIGVSNHDGTDYSTAGKIQLVSHGVYPFSMAAIPLFDAWDPRTWIDSGKLGDLWVKFECSTTGSTSCILKLLGDEVVTKYAV